jgi:hypothetical protein
MYFLYPCIKVHSHDNLLLIIFSASFTRISPDINFGNRVSRSIITLKNLGNNLLHKPTYIKLNC